jgi:cell division protein FtsB
MQRRMPSGQGPARRSGPGGRQGGWARRAAGGREGHGGWAGRAGGREGHGEASRPAVARRAGTGAGAARRTAAPRPRRLTGRATVLLVVLAALALGYAYPVRVYLSQQAEISRLEAGQQAQRKHIDNLAAQVEKWQDDAYVVSQARSRLYMVYPGEIPLVVLWDEEGAAREAGVAPKAEQPAPAPWYGKLWSSIEVANR